MGTMATQTKMPQKPSCTSIRQQRNVTNQKAPQPWQAQHSFQDPPGPPDNDHLQHTRRLPESQGSPLDEATWPNLMASPNPPNDSSPSTSTPITEETKTSNRPPPRTADSGQTTNLYRQHGNSGAAKNTPTRKTEATRGPQTNQTSTQSKQTQGKVPTRNRGRYQQSRSYSGRTQELNYTRTQKADTRSYSTPHP